MAQPIPARLTPAQAAAAGRKFGVTVGVAFIVLALIGRWRGHPTTSSVLGTLGVSLLVAGLAVPRALRPVERMWMGVASAISKITTPIFMGILYFGILTPVGFVRRIGGSALAYRAGRAGYWADRRTTPKSRLDRQF